MLFDEKRFQMNESIKLKITQICDEKIARKGANVGL